MSKKISKYGNASVRSSSSFPCFDKFPKSLTIQFLIIVFKYYTHEYNGIQLSKQEYTYT